MSVPGVYSGLVDKVPFEAAFAKGLTMKMGQTHTYWYMWPLLDRVDRRDIDASFVITHQFNLSDAPTAYETFLREKDECVKVVLKP